MKKGIFFIFLLLMMIVLGGSSQVLKNSSNSLSITKDDEKEILKYLDTKTNDILAPTNGKVYSAFYILGTDNDKIYTWVIKKEEIIRSSVSLPVVLNVETINGKIKVISHKFPRDGHDGAEDIKKLFPENVRHIMYDKNHNERIIQLQDIIENRIKQDR